MEPQLRRLNTQACRADSPHREVSPCSRSPSPRRSLPNDMPMQVDGPHLARADVQDDDRQVLLDAAARLETKYRQKCEAAVRDVIDNQLAPLQTRYQSLQQTYRASFAENERLKSKEKQSSAEIAASHAKVVQLTEEKASLKTAVSIHEQIQQDLRSTVAGLQAESGLKEHVANGLDAVSSKVHDLQQTVSKTIRQESKIDTELGLKLGGVLEAVHACSQQICDSQSTLGLLKDKIYAWDQRAIHTDLSAVASKLQEISSVSQAEHHQSQELLAKLHSAFEPITNSQQQFMHHLEGITELQSQLSSQ